MSGNTDEHAEGEHHLDDREPLAYAYDGTELIATIYRADIARECRSRWMDITLTPEGEEVLGT